MRRSFKHIIACAVLAYVLLGIAWVLASDSLLSALSPSPGVYSQLQQLKGALAVALGAGALLLMFTWAFRRAGLAQEALESREELSERMIETAEEGIWVLNSRHKTLFANRKLAEMLGISVEEFLERPVLDFVADDWHDTARERLEELRSGVRNSFEFKLKRTDGADLWTLVSTTPLYDRDGEYAGAFAMFTDITARKEAQKSLEKERQFLADILHNIRDGICILDTDMNIIRVNTAMQEWYSHALPLVGKKCYEAYHGRTAECETCPTRRVLDTRQPTSATVPLTGHAGKNEGWLYLYAFPLFDSETGELQGVIEYVRDITEQRRAEQALHESQRRFTAFMDHLPAAVFMKSSEGRILYVNRYMVETHDAGDWVGQSTADVLPDRLAQPIIANDQEALERGHVVVEEKVPDCNGEERVYETHKFSMLGEDGKQILGGFALDVTKRKRAQDALRASEIRYRTLFETANDAILLMREELFLDCNQRALELYGCERNQIIGGTPYEQFSPPFQPDGESSREKAQRKIRAALDGKPQSFEWQHRRLDGRYFFAEVSLNRIDLEDEVLLQAIVRDVSDRKRARDNLRRSREQLRALAAKLAETEEAERQRLSRELHDRVGSTLSALSMQLTRLERKLDSPDSTEADTSLEEAGALVQEVADQVRDITSELRPSVLDDYGLIAALEWYTTRFTDRTGISAVVEGEEPEPRLPGGVETGLFRIAQEALTNVAKHSGADRVVVSVDQDERKVEMRVEDDGTGFSDEVAQQTPDGAGWGLITMRERAHALSGELEVESETGQGTTVRVSVAR